MSYELPRWKPVNRLRLLKISYRDPQFVQFYDLDQQDFSSIALKLKNGIRLSENEDYRYWVHVATVILQVLEKPEWKAKSYKEKCSLYEFALPRVLKAVPSYDPARGTVLNIAFQACKNGFNMYYRRMKQTANKEKRIQDHLESCFSDYISEISDGKVNTREFD